ncbi:ROK family transcriptional regulator [Schaalia sp. ZJ405]|uniref:ROK family transcriptional regulator n=1 Tax=unclassified Schaalia TaxID=2691889 RepID=UPI0013ED6D56|nr:MULTISPECIES: ROK family transcriptional regulator [unclassified Schaalia]QPK81804.1 ROK family transcriptional regulator [Schaalia sp. ZJ405]
MVAHNGRLGSQASLREVNSARVADAIRRYGRITQVELAAATGLSSATISNIVKQLVERGVATTENTIRSGRRAQLVSLRTQSGLGIGIHIARRAMHIEIADSAYSVTARKILPLPEEHRIDTTLSRAAMLISELTEEIGADLSDVIGIGLCVPAPVDPVSQEISVPGFMRDWEDTDIRSLLMNRLERPVLVENDANAGAIGELRYGNLRGVDNGIYIRASYLCGAGMIVNGTLHRGPHGTAGEIGHIQVDPLGLICQCGNRGCLNTVVGANALVELLRVSRGHLSLRDVISLAKDGDPGCVHLMTDAGAMIGQVAANIATWTDTQRIVVGGELAETGDILLAPMAQAIRSRPMLMREHIDVLQTSLNGSAEAKGALALALDEFSDPISQSVEDAQ